MSIRRFIFLNEKLFMKIKKHILFTFFKPMDKILYRRNKRQSFFREIESNQRNFRNTCIDNKDNQKVRRQSVVVNLLIVKSNDIEIVHEEIT